MSHRRKVEKKKFSLGKGARTHDVPRHNKKSSKKKKEEGKNRKFFLLGQEVGLKEIYKPSKTPKGKTPVTLQGSPIDEIGQETERRHANRHCRGPEQLEKLRKLDIKKKPSSPTAGSRGWKKDKEGREKTVRTRKGIYRTRTSLPSGREGKKPENARRMKQKKKSSNGGKETQDTRPRLKKAYDCSMELQT